MKSIIICCVAILLGSCATPVIEVQPIAPPENSYVQQDCGQLEKICHDRENEIRLFAAKQDAKVSKDSTKMALNLLLLPVFWNIGNDENTLQFQNAMGHYQDAAKQAALLNCSFKPKPINEILKEYGTPGQE